MALCTKTILVCTVSLASAAGLAGLAACASFGAGESADAGSADGAPFCPREGSVFCADFDRGDTPAEGFARLEIEPWGGDSGFATSFTSAPRSVALQASARDDGRRSGLVLVRNLGSVPITCDFDWYPQSPAQDGPAVFFGGFRLAVSAGGPSTLDVSQTMTRKGEVAVLLSDAGSDTPKALSTFADARWHHTSFHVTTDRYDVVMDGTRVSETFPGPAGPEVALVLGPSLTPGSSPSPGWTFLYDNVVCTPN